MNNNKNNLILATAFCLLALPTSGRPIEKIEDGALPANDGKQPGPVVSSGPKISRRLSTSPQAGTDRIPVVVIYRQQPQREIVERVGQSVALHVDLAENELRRSTRAGDKAGKQATERLSQVRQESRLLVREAIRTEIEGFQLAKAAKLQGAGAVNLRRYWMHNMMTAEVTPQTLAELEADPDVAQVFPDPQIRLAATVSNSTIDVNTGVLGVAAWWNAGIKGAGQPVVVLDTGINAAHPVFQGKEIVARSFLGSVRNNRCFADDPNSPEDRNGHGTHVAGIVAGAGESLLPNFQGTAPEVGQIFALKIGANMSGIGSCPDNSISGTDVLNAIEWALENTSAKIFNMSFGGEAGEDDPPFAQLIDEIAESHGLTIVAAAGNEGQNGPSSVGDTGLSFNGITVANWDTRGTFSKQDDRVHPSSSLGPTIGGRFKPDLAAPGTQILSASNRGSGLVRLTGTSMASPKVAGVAALLHQGGITDPASVKALLINTTDHVGWKADRGWGLINLETARAANHVVGGEVSSASQGGFALFRGRNNGDFYATLVWNRHGSFERGFVFHDLDLFVYDGEGRQTASSESGKQNVEQVAVRTTGDVIVKVRAFNENFAAGITREKFALAISQGDFVPVAGPVLAAACTADASTVARGAQVLVTCSLTNRGDLAGRETKITTNLGGIAIEDAGTISEGQHLERRYRVTMPAQPGTYGIQFGGSTVAAGETIAARTIFDVTVR